MIALQRDATVWTVTLNRPDKANALTPGMLARLDEIFSDAAMTDSLRCLVITGAGDKVFCAGADLTAARASGNFTTNPIWEQVSARLAALPCLTICALNGTLAGGGFGIALACDLRISVPAARFFYPVLRNGFLPQPSDVVRMNELIGPARTSLILLAARKLSADQALSFGLIDLIIDAQDMDRTIVSLAEAVCNSPAAPVAAIKALIRRGGNQPVASDARAAVYQQDEDALARLRSYMRYES